MAKGAAGTAGSLVGVIGVARGSVAERSGAVLFGRYAYPPNELGYCGPDASAQLLEQVSAHADDGDLRRLVKGFDGAWPYLELIAGAAGIRDPLDRRVVEAYWVGNELLERVDPLAMGSSMDDRFRDRVSRVAFGRMISAVPAGALPHHSFHVFGVYPWLGLLRGGRVDEPLRVLDRCRVRWGRVVATTDDGHARVMSRPLTWDGHRLILGVPREEVAVLRLGALGLSRALRPGEWCALHWDWVCDRLNRTQVAALHRYTRGQLAVVNAQAYPAPAAVLS